MTGWPPGSAQIGERTGDLDELATGADTLADSLGDVRAQVNSIAPSIQSLLDAFSSLKTQYGGDKLVRDVETAAKLVDSINKLGNAMGVNFAAVKDMFAWIGPVLIGAERQCGLRRQSLVQRHPRPVPKA